MAEKRPINVELATEMAKQFAKEYQETEILDFAVHSGVPIVQVMHDSLIEVSGPEMWIWRERSPELGSPWEASVIIDGVKFLAIFTDEEKAEALEQ